MVPLFYAEQLILQNFSYNKATLLYRQMGILLGEANVFRSLGDLEINIDRGLALQRHFRVLTKFAHVE
jgi:hypothetical protein